MSTPDNEIRRVIVPLDPPGRALVVVEPFPGPVVATGSTPARPCVVMSSGLGGAWFDWIAVARRLAPHMRVLVVDRPGVGDAPDWDPGTDDLDTAAHDLVAALDGCGVRRAVLVGHSMGAWYVEAAARLHPDRMSGLVLVDGSTAAVPGPSDRVAAIPEPVARVRRLAADGAVAALDAVARRSAGWGRVGPALRAASEGPGPREGDRDAHRTRASATYSRPGMWRASAREWAAYPSMARRIARLRVTHRLPDVPVEVLAADTRLLPPSLAPWTRMQERQRAGLTRTGGRVAEAVRTLRPAPHMVMLTHPDEVAALVLDTVDRAGETGPAAPHPHGHEPPTSRPDLT